MRDMWGMEDYHEDWPGVYVPPEHKVVTVPRIIDELKRREKFTPDFKKLRLHEDILVFVYDDFKMHGSANRVLSESKYLGVAVSSHDNYVLKGHAYPTLVDAGRNTIRARIKGEVYAVPPETILMMDKQKFNGNLYRRVQRTFFLNNQTYKTKKGPKHPSVRAWVYIGVPEHWSMTTLPIYPRYAYQGSRDKKFFEYDPTLKNLY